MKSMAAGALGRPQRLPSAMTPFSGSKDIAAVCRELQVSEATYHRWRKRAGIRAHTSKLMLERSKKKSVSLAVTCATTRHLEVARIGGRVREAPPGTDEPRHVPIGATS